MQNKSILTSIKHIFQSGTAVMQLVYINIGVFITLKLIGLVLVLLNIPMTSAAALLELPSNLQQLLLQPWSAVTYMFVHLSIGHIFFNMLTLYWFGSIALEHFSQRQIVALYLLGGIAGGLLFVGAYNLFPYFSDSVDRAVLLGASGAVLSVMCAAATVSPHREVSLMFIGSIRLVWIAVGLTLISLFSITGSNAGGEFAHIGGAVFGFLYGRAWQRGSDWLRPLDKMNFRIKGLLTRKQKGPKIKQNYRPSERAKTDAEYNRMKKENNDRIDKILDKIKQRGYESLTADEKRELFDRSRKA